MKLPVAPTDPEWDGLVGVVVAFDCDGDPVVLFALRRCPCLLGGGCDTSGLVLVYYGATAPEASALLRLALRPSAAVQARSGAAGVAVDMGG